MRIDKSVAHDWSTVLIDTVPQGSVSEYGRVRVLYKQDGLAEDYELVIAGYASPQVVDREKHLITKEAMQADLPRFLAHPHYRNAMIVHCAVAGTKVKVTGNRYVNIEDVQPGDMVYTHRGRLRPVMATTKHEGPARLMQITLENGEVLRVTENHRLLTTEGWVHAHDLTTEHTLNHLVKRGHRSWQLEEQTGYKGHKLVKGLPRQETAEQYAMRMERLRATKATSERRGNGAAVTAKQRQGKTLTEAYGEGKATLWVTRIADSQRGERSHFWKDGVSRRPYGAGFSNELKELIRDRDGRVCTECSRTEAEELADFERHLSVDHISWDKQDHSPENLRSLCVFCHGARNGEAREVVANGVRILAVESVSNSKPVYNLEVADDSSYAGRGCIHHNSNIQVGEVLPTWTNPETKEEFVTKVDDLGLFCVIKLRTDKYRPEICSKVEKDVREGKLASFSISGDAPFDSRRHVCNSGTCFWIIDKIEFYEITICEQGVNQDAKFAVMSKAAHCRDGSCPLQLPMPLTRVALASEVRKHQVSKDRKYLGEGEEPPPGADVKTGERGGRYYEGGTPEQARQPAQGGGGSPLPPEVHDLAVKLGRHAAEAGWTHEEAQQWAQGVAVDNRVKASDVMAVAAEEWARASTEDGKPAKAPTRFNQRGQSDHGNVTEFDDEELEPFELMQKIDATDDPAIVAASEKVMVGKLVEEIYAGAQASGSFRDAARKVELRYGKFGMPDEYLDAAIDQARKRKAAPERQQWPRRGARPQDVFGLPRRGYGRFGKAVTGGAGGAITPITPMQGPEAAKDPSKADIVGEKAGGSAMGHGSVGAVAKGETEVAEDFANRLWESIGRPHDFVQFRRGLGVEWEHADVLGGDWLKVAQVVLDHLAEDEEYYTKLATIEKRSGGRGGRVYLKPGENAPEGVEVQTGPSGGRYYDKKGGTKPEAEAGEKPKGYAAGGQPSFDAKTWKDPKLLQEAMTSEYAFKKEHGMSAAREDRFDRGVKQLAGLTGKTEDGVVWALAEAYDAKAGGAGGEPQVPPKVQKKVDGMTSDLGTYMRRLEYANEMRVKMGNEYWHEPKSYNARRVRKDIAEYQRRIYDLQLKLENWTGLTVAPDDVAKALEKGAHFQRSRMHASKMIRGYSSRSNGYEIEPHKGVLQVWYHIGDFVELKRRNPMLMARLTTIKEALEAAGYSVKLNDEGDGSQHLSVHPGGGVKKAGFAGGGGADVGSGWAVEVHDPTTTGKKGGLVSDRKFDGAAEPHSPGLVVSPPAGPLEQKCQHGFEKGDQTWGPGDFDWAGDQDDDGDVDDDDDALGAEKEDRAQIGEVAKIPPVPQIRRPKAPKPAGVTYKAAIDPSKATQFSPTYARDDAAGGEESEEYYLNKRCPLCAARDIIEDALDDHGVYGAMSEEFRGVLRHSLAALQAGTGGLDWMPGGGFVALSDDHAYAGFTRPGYAIPLAGVVAAIGLAAFDLGNVRMVRKAVKVGNLILETHPVEEREFDEGLADIQERMARELNIRIEEDEGGQELRKGYHIGWLGDAQRTLESVKAALGGIDREAIGDELRVALDAISADMDHLVGSIGMTEQMKGQVKGVEPAALDVVRTVAKDTEGDVQAADSALEVVDPERIEARADGEKDEMSDPDQVAHPSEVAVMTGAPPGVPTGNPGASVVHRAVMPPPRGIAKTDEDSDLWGGQNRGAGASPLGPTTEALDTLDQGQHPAYGYNRDTRPEGLTKDVGAPSAGMPEADVAVNRGVAIDKEPEDPLAVAAFEMEPGAPRMPDPDSTAGHVEEKDTGARNDRFVGDPSRVRNARIRKDPATDEPMNVEGAGVGRRNQFEDQGPPGEVESPQPVREREFDNRGALVPQLNMGAEDAKALFKLHASLWSRYVSDPRFGLAVIELDDGGNPVQIVDIAKRTGRGRK
jgi:hypothetical protein